MGKVFRSWDVIMIFGGRGGVVAGSFSEDQDSRIALSWELMGLCGYKE